MVKKQRRSPTGRLGSKLHTVSQFHQTVAACPSMSIHIHFRSSLRIAHRRRRRCRSGILARPPVYRHKIQGLTRIVPRPVVQAAFFRENVHLHTLTTPGVCCRRSVLAPSAFIASAIWNSSVTLICHNPRPSTTIARAIPTACSATHIYIFQRLYHTCSSPSE